jgi:hypothetical protein
MLLVDVEDIEHDTRAFVACLHLNTCHPVRQFAYSHLTGISSALK